MKTGTQYFTADELQDLHFLVHLRIKDMRHELQEEMKYGNNPNPYFASELARAQMLRDRLEAMMRIK